MATAVNPALVLACLKEAEANEKHARAVHSLLIGVVDIQGLVTAIEATPHRSSLTRLNGLESGTLAATTAAGGRRRK